MSKTARVSEARDRLLRIEARERVTAETAHYQRLHGCAEVYTVLDVWRLRVCNQSRACACPRHHRGCNKAAAAMTTRPQIGKRASVKLSGAEVRTRHPRAAPLSAHFLYDNRVTRTVAEQLDLLLSALIPIDEPLPPKCSSLITAVTLRSVSLQPSAADAPAAAPAAADATPSRGVFGFVKAILPGSKGAEAPKKGAPAAATHAAPSGTIVAPAPTPSVDLSGSDRSGGASSSVGSASSSSISSNLLSASAPAPPLGEPEDGLTDADIEVRVPPCPPEKKICVEQMLATSASAGLLPYGATTRPQHAASFRSSTDHLSSVLRVPFSFSSFCL